jgi:hypothetical protein
MAIPAENSCSEVVKCLHSLYTTFQSTFFSVHQCANYLSGEVNSEYLAILIIMSKSIADNAQINVEFHGRLFFLKRVELQ